MDETFNTKVNEAEAALARLDDCIAKMRSLLKKPKIEFSLQDPKDANEINLTQITVGKNVQWEGKQGTVVQLYKRQISKVINEQAVSITGSPENPAVLIKDAEGNEYLKLAREVSLLS